MMSTNVALYAGDSAKLAIANGMLSAATVSELSVIFQIFTLLYIANGLFINFLPLAIVMRSMPFMRQFGGALIAIFVALYIMYPAMVVLDAYIVPSLATSIMPEVHAKTPSSEPANPAANCDIIERPFTAKSTIGPQYAPYPSITCTSDGMREDDLAANTGITENKMEELLVGAPTLEQALMFNALIFISAVFLPALNFIVIAALARDLSRFLGDEADISRLGQMI